MPEAFTSLARASHSCFVSVDREVKCWGDNASGELGNGTIAPSPYPVAVGGVSDVLSVAVAPAVSCAVSTDGSVICWGRSQSVMTPTRLRGFEHIVRVAVTQGGICALGRDARVTCLHGSVPEVPFGGQAAEVLRGAKELAAGVYRFCAILQSGTPTCWDHFDDESGVDLRLVMSPREIKSINGAHGLASAMFDNRWCAIDADGRVVCWGDYAEFDKADPVWANFGVVRVPGVYRATRLSLGVDLGCAAEGESVACWQDHRGPQYQPPRTLSAPAAVVDSADWGLSEPDAHACIDGRGRVVRCVSNGGDRRLFENNTTPNHLRTLSPEDLATPPAPAIPNEPECAGSNHIRRCYYEWSGVLRPTLPSTPPRGTSVFAFDEGATMTVGGRMFLVSTVDPRVDRELLVSEVIGGEAFVRARLHIDEPDRGQPDGNELLLATYEQAVWTDGTKIYVVMTKKLFNPP